MKGNKRKLKLMPWFFFFFFPLFFKQDKEKGKSRIELDISTLLSLLLIMLNSGKRRRFQTKEIQSPQTAQKTCPLSPYISSKTSSPPTTYLFCPLLCPHSHSCLFFSSFSFLFFPSQTTHFPIATTIPSWTTTDGSSSKQKITRSKGFLFFLFCCN